MTGDNDEKRNLKRLFRVAVGIVAVLFATICGLIAMMWNSLSAQLENIDERTLENRERIIRLEVVVEQLKEE